MYLPTQAQLAIGPRRGCIGGWQLAQADLTVRDSDVCLKGVERTTPSPVGDP
jgi:hypothetical protein